MTGEEIKPRTKTRNTRTILLGIFILLVFALLGAFLGYRSGIQARLKNYQNQVALSAAAQFQLGLIDLADGRFVTAQKRFEYVIQLDPNFPEAEVKLQEAMLGAATSTQPTIAAVVPTITPEPEMTATPDLRNRDELVNEAQSLMKSANWAEAINALDQVRYIAPDHLAAKVDGLYYMAYRNMGVQKILYDGNLEGGMYDLSIASRFGILDTEANGYRTYARFYVTGAAFWEVDWVQVLNYFSQVYQALPNLRDGSGYTAVERFRLASIGYGDQLFAANEFCPAQEQYEIAYGMNANAEGLYDKLELARQNCEGEQNPPPAPDTGDQPTLEPTLEGTPTGELTPEPTLEPTLEPTSEGTSTGD